MVFSGGQLAESSGGLGTQRPAQMLGDVVTSLHELVEVDVGLDPQAMEHVHDILRGDVASGALGIRAASKARHRRVHYVDPHLKGDEDVGKGLPIRIVEMNGNLVHRDKRHDSLKHSNHATWCPDTSRVAERDLRAAHGIQLLSYVRHLRRIGCASNGASNHT